LGFSGASLKRYATMDDIWQQALGSIDGGRMLDVATDQGRFIDILEENLGRCAAFVGVDTRAAALEVAHRAAFNHPTRFIQMDAGRLGFVDRSFDTVSMSASLHHLVDIPLALAEAMRVLRPGGHLVAAEMHSSAATEAQRTAIQAHHWIADVDRALGASHYHTLARQEIVAQVAALGLGNVSLYDWADLDADPLDQGAIIFFDSVLDRTLRKARGLADYPALAARGRALRRRLHTVGIQHEPRLVVVGQKAPL
jgi:ubiquinone/menaquinone biosynthesis C-methylase UbiE